MLTGFGFLKEVTKEGGLALMPAFMLRILSRLRLNVLEQHYEKKFMNFIAFGFKT